MRAKFSCVQVNQNAHSEEAFLNAVYADGQPENNEFNEATPSGQLKMTIDSSKAKGYFKPGKDYYLDFSEAK